MVIDGQSEKLFSLQSEVSNESVEIIGPLDGREMKNIEGEAEKEEIGVKEQEKDNKKKEEGESLEESDSGGRFYCFLFAFREAAVICVFYSL